MTEETKKKKGDGGFYVKAPIDRVRALDAITRVLAAIPYEDRRKVLDAVDLVVDLPPAGSPAPRTTKS